MGLTSTKEEKPPPSNENEILDDPYPFYYKEKGILNYKPPGEWIRPLGSTEKYFAQGSFVGSLNAGQMIWLTSKVPLEEFCVLKALYELVRHHAVLQVYLDCKNGDWWFRRAERVDVDFSKCDGDPLDIFYTEVNENINVTKCPIWKARLVHVCDRTETENAQYKYALIFVLPHSITDATTNYTLCRHTVMILNRELMGKTEEQIPYYPVVPFHCDTDSNVSRIQFYSRYLMECIIYFFTPLNLSLMLEWIVPSPPLKVTKSFKKELSAERSKNLVAKCKKEGVTVNSCICALLNLAFWKLSKQCAGKQCSKVNIVAGNFVNMRRYHPNEDQVCDGCFISCQPLFVSLDDESPKMIWDDARRIRADVHEAIKKSYPIAALDFLVIFRPLYCLNVLLSKLGAHHWTRVHYSTSNMGNIDTLLPKSSEADYVDIIDQYRTVSNPFGMNSLLASFQTFRGNFSLTLDWYTSKVDPKMVTQYFEYLCQYLDNISA